MAERGCLAARWEMAKSVCDKTANGIELVIREVGAKLFVEIINFSHRFQQSCTTRLVADIPVSYTHLTLPTKP